MNDNLELAVKSDRVDVIKSYLSTLQDTKTAENELLLEEILRKPSFNGETLLHMASKEDKFDIVRTLLSAKADPTITDTNGRYAYQISASEKTRFVYREILLQAASQSNITQVEQLIKCGVNVNFQDTLESGNTPLHWGASFADVKIVECLCKHGADVHAINVAGCSPLHDAVVRGNHNVVYCLLQYGADPALQITNGKYSGKTCYELAEGKPEVLDVLNNPPAVLEVLPVQVLDKTDTLQNGKTPLKLSLANGNLSNTDHMSPTLTNQSSGTPSTPQLMSPVFKRAPCVDEIGKPPLVVTEEKLGLLWPQPQHIEQHEGRPFCPRLTLPVFISAGKGSDLRKIRHKWCLHAERFESLNVQLSVEPLTPLSDQGLTHIICHVSQRLCPGKGSYKLNIMQNQLRVVCNDCDTLHYAIATVIQLFSSYYDTDSKEIQLPQLLIEDWPVTPYRGVLFDISQGRVPNLETFKETVKRLALLKINQVYLYTRFRNLEEFAWQVCYGMDEIMGLDEYCSQYGITLYPVLEVAPTVQYDDLSQLYPVFQDYLTCFNYNDFVSVGPRLSSFLLDVGDNNEVSLSDCNTLLPLGTDQTLQLCGYPLHDLQHNLLSQLPPHFVFNEYGVQASHDYMEHCRPLSKHGLSFFVCPGTGAWNSLAGCPEAALTNVYNAMKCASSEGALGLIVCNWSGKGHITHLPFCWPGFLMGAGLSWNSNCHWEYCLGNLEELMNLHVFQSDKGVVGHAIVELGRAETYLLRCARCQTGEDCSDLPPEHGSLLYQFLLHPDAAKIDNLTPEMLQRVMRHVRKCQVELKNIELKCSQSSDVIAELQLTCDLMLLAVKIGRALVVSGRNPSGQAGLDVVNLGITNLSPTVKTDLANKLLELLKIYESLWRKRYLEHGLKYSLAAIQGLLKQFIPDEDPTALSQAGGDGL